LPPNNPARHLPGNGSGHQVRLMFLITSVYVRDASIPLVPLSGEAQLKTIQNTKERTYRKRGKAGATIGH